jgi:hypothetical protein
MLERLRKHLLLWLTGPFGPPTPDQEMRRRLESLQERVTALEGHLEVLSHPVQSSESSAAEYGSIPDAHLGAH